MLFRSVNDGTALAICHIERMDTSTGPKDFIELDCIEVRYPKDEGREHFQPEEMADWIATFTDKFFIVKGMMDQYYGLAVVPRLHEKGHKQIQTMHVNREFSSKVYQNLMSKMLDGGLRIPEGTENVDEGKKTTDLPLIREMLKLQATVHSKYQITIKAPEIQGMHDDMSDAFARAVYLATEYMNTGGGIAKQNVLQTTGPSGTYRSYMRKAKRSAIYTNRPSTAMITELSRTRQFSSGIPRMFGGR